MPVSTPNLGENTSFFSEVAWIRSWKISYSIHTAWCDLEKSFKVVVPQFRFIYICNIISFIPQIYVEEQIRYCI